MATVTSTANAAVKAARKLVRRHGRDEADEFLVEGPALVEGRDALVRVFATADADAAVLHAVQAAGVEVVEVDDRVARELSDTVTDRGLVGIARLARPSLDAAMEAAMAGGRGRGRVLVADGVADPGNAGTLIRTADAAGFDAVVFTNGSVDPRNPKTVRATAGSLFHLPVVDRVDVAELVAACAPAGLRLVGAVADAPRSYTDADLAGGVALVVGNEAHGLSDAAAAALEDVVAVPMHPQPRPGYTGVAESLNLAASAAVIMFESTRQRTSVAAVGRRRGEAGA